jgi:hypothetical protein
MNEQIKQAALNAANSIADDFVVGFCDHRMVEHFAAHIEKHTTALMESMVQECIDQIESYQIPVGNSPAGELASEWTYDALSTIRDSIKEHLGIKPCE